MASYRQETLGIDIIPKFVTGMSWKAQLAERIFSETGDKALKDAFGEHNWNVGKIDKLVAASAKPLLPGADRALAMKAITGVTIASAQSFLKHINAYRNKEATPSVAKNAGELAAKLAESAGNVAEGLGEGAKAAPTVLLILAAGIGAYLMFAGKRGVNLIPSLKIGK